MHKCADCGLDLEQIRILDATVGTGGTGVSHVDLEYAPMFAEKAGWFSGTAKGTCPITGMICPKCRRISLYG